MTIIQKGEPMDDLISRQAAIDAILHITNCKSVRELFEYNQEHHLTEMWSGGVNDAIDAVIGVESATDTNVATKVGTNLAEVGTDLISRAATQTELQLSARRYTVAHEAHGEGQVVWSESLISVSDAMDTLRKIPSAQPEQRYTEEELRVFQHGISLSLLSKRSSQHWRYDEDTATEIKFLERLYEKVSADMRGAE